MKRLSSNNRSVNKDYRVFAIGAFPSSGSNGWFFSIEGKILLYFEQFHFHLLSYHWYIHFHCSNEWTRTVTAAQSCQLMLLTTWPMLRFTETVFTTIPVTDRALSYCAALYDGKCFLEEWFNGTEDKVYIGVNESGTMDTATFCTYVKTVVFPYVFVSPKQFLCRLFWCIVRHWNKSCYSLCWCSEWPIPNGFEKTRAGYQESMVRGLPIPTKPISLFTFLKLLLFFSYYS